jgi:carboxymethylenebutenolidase
MNIKTEKVQLDVAGHSMPAYLAHPEGAAPRPAVIVIEEIFGLNSFIRSVVDRLAHEGYVAIAPEIHHRASGGGELDLAYDAAGMKRGMELIPKLGADGFKTDLDATLAFLRARADVKRDRVGVMGFCIGGHLAYLAACVSDVRATASFYGGGIAVFSPGGGAPTVTRSGSIKGRVLCLFGGKDHMIPEAQVATIRKALEDHQIRHEVVVYPQAGHAFFCDDAQRGAYNAEAAADAWTRVKKLFADELGG